MMGGGPPTFAVEPSTCDGNATVASSRVGAEPGLWLLRLPLLLLRLWLVTSLITSRPPHCLDFIDLSHVHSYGLSGEQND